jgi:hypothetical protein
MDEEMERKDENMRNWSCTSIHFIIFQIFLNIEIFLLWFPLQKYALQLLIPSTTIQNFVSSKLVSDKNKKNC